MDREPLVLSPSEPIGERWRLLELDRYYPRTSEEAIKKSLRVAHKALNDQERTIAYLETELTRVEEQVKSLRQDLTQFSTFEQICNSGMLRNFKIDSDSEFAQVILKLLQQTMELQISHLQTAPDPRQESDEDPDT